MKKILFALVCATAVPTSSWADGGNSGSTPTSWFETMKEHPWASLVMGYLAWNYGKSWLDTYRKKQNISELRTKAYQEKQNQLHTKFLPKARTDYQDTLTIIAKTPTLAHSLQTVPSSASKNLERKFFMGKLGRFYRMFSRHALAENMNAHLRLKTFYKIYSQAIDESPQTINESPHNNTTTKHSAYLDHFVKNHHKSRGFKVRFNVPAGKKGRKKPRFSKQPPSFQPQP